MKNRSKNAKKKENKTAKKYFLFKKIHEEDEEIRNVRTLKLKENLIIKVILLFELHVFSVKIQIFEKASLKELNKKSTICIRTCKIKR